MSKVSSKPLKWAGTFQHQYRPTCRWFWLSSLYCFSSHWAGRNPCAFWLPWVDLHGICCAFMFFHILRPLRTSCVFHNGTMIMKFDMRDYSSLLSHFHVQTSMSQRWKFPEKGKAVASRVCCKLLEKDKTVESRECCKLLQNGQRVASRACWKSIKKDKNVASRACCKVLEKNRAQHQECAESYVRKIRP